MSGEAFMSGLHSYVMYMVLMNDFFLFLPLNTRKIKQFSAVASFGRYTAPVRWYLSQLSRRRW